MDSCDCVGQMCCECWKEGCGCDGCFGCVADGLEVINPIMEYVADCIWILGSPLAFPIVYLFPPPPETNPPGGGWQISMNASPIRQPLQCCAFSLCCPCAQWWIRYQALGGDLTKYKLWQGYHDGPQCLARRCPGAPITIESGTYGEQQCPAAFLALEVTVLGCAWSLCCAHDVSRRYMKDERNLGEDPTEVRVSHCIGFFSQLASSCWMLGCCVCLTGCLVGCCAPDSGGAQECSGEMGRAGASCRSCAYTCWRGIWSVQFIAMGCATTQMNYEITSGAPPLASRPTVVAPTNQSMNDRGGPADGEEEWWKKPNQ